MTVADYHSEDIGAGEGIASLMRSSDHEDPVLGSPIGTVPQTSSSDEGSIEFTFREGFTDVSEAEILHSYESLILKAIRQAISDDEEEFLGLKDSSDLEDMSVHEVIVENKVDGPFSSRKKATQIISLPKTKRLPNERHPHPFCEQCEKECKRIMWISGPGRSKKVFATTDVVDKAGDAGGKTGRRGGRRRAIVSGKRDHQAVCDRGHSINIPIPKSFRNKNFSSRYWSHSPPNPPSPNSLPFPRFLMEMKSESSSDDESYVHQM